MTSWRQCPAPAHPKLQRIGIDQPPAAPHPPRIAQVPARHPLAHRRAAQHHRLQPQEPRVGRHLYLDRARQSRGVEQDRLLRHPRRVRANRQRQPRRHSRAHVHRPIDPLRRLRGDRRARPSLPADPLLHHIAFGKAPCGVDQYRFPLAGPHRQPRKTHPQATALVHLARHRAVPQTPKRQTQRASAANSRKCRGRRGGHRERRVQRLNSRRDCASVPAPAG